MAVKLVTGDHPAMAAEAAKALDIGHSILGAWELPRFRLGSLPLQNLVEEYAHVLLPAHGLAQALPEHKYLLIDCLRRCRARWSMAKVSCARQHSRAMAGSSCGELLAPNSHQPVAAARVLNPPHSTSLGMRAAPSQCGHLAPRDGCRGTGARPKRPPR